MNPESCSSPRILPDAMPGLHCSAPCRGCIMFKFLLFLVALFALALPRGVWGLVEDRTALRLLPIGYRVVLKDAKRKQ